MDQSNDLVEDFVGHLVERREGLLLLDLLQLLFLENRRGWWCEQLLLLREL